MSRPDVRQVVSFRKLRTMQNGPEMCALDTAKTTISSSSLQDCSLGCVRDGYCTGFRIKDSHTCGLYNYKPKINLLISDCMFYQVSTILRYCVRCFSVIFYQSCIEIHMPSL